MLSSTSILSHKRLLYKYLLIVMMNAGVFQNEINVKQVIISLRHGKTSTRIPVLRSAT
jgi:hypothetical protein